MLALDVESGGIGEDKTLLEVFMAALSKDFNIVDELHIRVKPDDGVYHVTAQGLEVNKIDIVEHDKTAITYKEAGTKIYNFLNSNFNNDILNPKREKFIPAGHGVAFDCRFLKKTVISEGSWDKYVSYRSLCTSSVARFLMVCGKLPELSGSLGSLVEYFQIPRVGELHEAKTDVLMSIEVLKRLISICQGGYSRD